MVFFFFYYNSDKNLKIAIPPFVVGLYCLLIFAVSLKWLPAIGVGESGNLISKISHLIPSSDFSSISSDSWSISFSDKTLGLLFFNPSLRTRLSTQKAAQNLGLPTMVMNFSQESWALEFEDGTKMSGLRSEHVREAAAVVSQSRRRVLRNQAEARRSEPPSLHPVHFGLDWEAQGHRPRDGRLHGRRGPLVPDGLRRADARGRRLVLYCGELAASFALPFAARRPSCRARGPWTCRSTRRDLRDASSRPQRHRRGTRPRRTAAGSRATPTSPTAPC